jgi:hypothetical protein
MLTPSVGPHYFFSRTWCGVLERNAGLAQGDRNVADATVVLVDQTFDHSSVICAGTGETSGL